ncbi:unnamed protein product, partial [Ectocarpus sp. 8 AP-2014]
CRCSCRLLPSPCLLLCCLSAPPACRCCSWRCCCMTAFHAPAPSFLLLRAATAAAAAAALRLLGHDTGRRGSGKRVGRMIWTILSLCCCAASRVFYFVFRDPILR